MRAVPGLLNLTHVSDLRVMILGIAIALAKLRLYTKTLEKQQERNKDMETNQSPHVSLAQSSPHHNTRSAGTGGEHSSHLKVRRWLSSKISFHVQCKIVDKPWMVELRCPPDLLQHPRA